MKVKTTTQTKIDLTATDVKKIVTDYLASKGIIVKHINSQVKTVYSGPSDYGSEEFTGMIITADVIDKTIEL